MAITATLSPVTGVLTVTGDDSDNYFNIYRDSAGNLFVNGDGDIDVVVQGGTPTMTNTTRIEIFGLGGNDDAIHSDIINGLLPPTTLAFGPGDDTYIVENASRHKVIEKSDEGTDTVICFGSYSLKGQYIENLTLASYTLAGESNFNGTGNSLDNIILGNDYNNVLDGGAGADNMTGGAGNDTYIVDNAGDVVKENNRKGTDQVESSVSFDLTGQYLERLTLTGSGNTYGRGNSLDNTLTGNAGNNYLNGSAGADVLTGGLGADAFVFRDTLVAGIIDTITDFNVADDRIQLGRTAFAAIATGARLSVAQFAANASGTAQDASDRIVYETDTGKLFYDSNGNAAGGAVQFAKIDAGLALTSADFVIR
ncbi:calcium-binding protein [Reyranella sp.]|uniref:calcium-binding protein n=1 Tax=Reyranella sp. TaxID=1929291 RepID=UPI003D0C09CF